MVRIRPWSEKALRSALIWACRLLSSTIRPGQTRLISSSLLATAPWCLDQHHEYIESTPAEFHQSAVGENFTALRQDPETTELEARRGFGYGIHGRRL